MAALVYIVCSVGVNVFQIVRQCANSGWSIRTAIDIIKESHNGILVERYLRNIDQIYGHRSIIHSVGIECFGCRQQVQRSDMYEVDGYTVIDDAVEAFEDISIQVNFGPHENPFEKFWFLGFIFIFGCVVNEQKLDYIWLVLKQVRRLIICSNNIPIQ